MALNVWTKPTGYNLGFEPGTNLTVNSGSFITGYQYVIQSVGTTDFTKIGAQFNTVGTIFTATNNGSEAGPEAENPTTGRTEITPGSGTASRVAFTERIAIDFALPVTDSSGVSFAIISGALPPGLRLEGDHIVGSAFEVPRVTDFQFCIRASKDGQISDRTFTMTIEGEDAPTWVTPEGLLGIGDHQEFYVLDSSFVDYSLEAIDTDISTGQRLSYFIDSDGGQLPPGLRLTTDGRIVGFIEPATAITPKDGDGTYDNSYYDAVSFDFSFTPTNGYDSFIYDNVFYDYALQSYKPKKLNRMYQFIVSVTDGDTLVKRKFKIFVIGDDYFRADNTTLQTADGTFTSDVTYLRAPTWITSSYLGLYRANNFITLILDTYETENVIYNLEAINSNARVTSRRVIESDNVVGSRSLTVTLPSNVPTVGHFLTFAGLIQGATSTFNRVDVVESLPNNEYRLTLYNPLDINVPDGLEFLIGTKSELPLGMAFDENNAEVFGLVPYQPAITKTYTFTVTASRLADKISELEYSVIPANTESVINSIRINKTNWPGTEIALQNLTSITVNDRTISAADIISIDYSDSTDFIINLSSNITIILGERIKLDYSLITGERANNSRIFTVDILGEVDSVLTWDTPSDLGSINANFVSTLSVKATSTIVGDNLIYTLTSGRLPPGLILDLDGEIVGKVNQYATSTELGLTTFDFDTGVTTFDGGTTTVDKTYTFTVQARDQYGYSAITREFTIKIDTPNQLVFSNIRVKPFLKQTQREAWSNFIENTSVFTPSSIYRANDPNFGIQTDLSMLVFAGIETKVAAAYISAMGLNHKRKRFQFGTVQKAVAYVPGTTTAVYEVVYIEMLDPLEPNGKRLPNQLSNLSKNPQSVTVDTSNAIWSTKINDLLLDEPFLDRPNNIITADSTAYHPSSPNTGEYFPNSVTNWRERLKYWSDGDESFAVERNYLPLWMRSIQPGTKEEIDFKLAIPVCYCKVGYADDIILNIKNYLKTSGFAFNQLDYTADRYIIDSVEGQTQDKYLVFRNDRITV